ncbi:YdcF family protein [Xanthobacter sp. KR7-65]|uniref:YdcF family protein n=1 Tax=Xanthobacter sp. KR7-65 TaxID=3156612 RepID=UPI0032B34D03
MTMSNTERRTVGQSRPGQGRNGDAAPRRRTLARRLVIAAVLLAGAGGVAGAAGFIAFTALIAGREPAAVRPADAIVVLTGGPSRIIDAVGLLKDGRGQRLLITGVNPATSPDEMRRALPDGERLIGCCIDLGHKALNTRGNALEVAEWARDRSFRSLVVVTSSWHMPRAMMELSRALPDVELVAYPVVTSRTEPERWWSDFGTLKLLFKEYLKYIMATVKFRPAQAVAGPGDPASAPSEAEPAAPRSGLGAEPHRAQARISP